MGEEAVEATVEVAEEATVVVMEAEAEAEATVVVAEEATLVAVEEVETAEGGVVESMGCLGFA